MSDEFTPRYVGDLANPLQITLMDYSNVAYDLTGLNVLTAFEIELINTSNNAVITGGGTWSIINAVNGVVLYHWVLSDVSVAGTYKIKVIVTFSTGDLTFDQKIIEILP